MDRLKSHEIPDEVDSNNWTLNVTGAVSQPVQLTLDDIENLPAKTFEDDFTCVEGWRAQDLAWRGINVESVISKASPKANAAYVLVRAMDENYASSFPLERARDALLAFELDGQPLPAEHGGPVRLIPTDDDTDCWESIKWVSTIEITERKPKDKDTAKQIALNRVD